MEDEVIPAIAGDTPDVVVEVHVMEPAEQDASVDVGATALRVGIDVVGLAVGSGAIAAGDAAPAVADSQGETLPG